MANPEHIGILKRGVEFWNAWRAHHPSVQPDLTRADLPYKTLNGADFSDTIFCGADFVRTTLVGSLFRRADLSGADFSEGDLRKADFSGAQLYRALLLKTNLHRTDFSGAKVRAINASQASLMGTVFADLDLSEAIGLDSCEHLGPSTVDHRTMSLSRNLPLAFLRGCGLSDLQIKASFVSGGIETVQLAESKYQSCFISYSTRDQEFACRLHGDLQNNGVRCWFAPDDLKIGDRFRQHIDEAIHLHDKLLLILSTHSVQSDWVREEVESCLERERRETRSVLLPVRLDDAIMETGEAWAASIRRQRHIGDFTKWEDEHTYLKRFERLLRDLLTR